jgi:formate/nitrite transporter FocA (FNT family)
MTETPKKVPGADIIDPLLPPEMALACETAGVAKAGRDVLALIILGLLAGAFIAFGAIFMTVVLTSQTAIPVSVTDQISGIR